MMATFTSDGNNSNSVSGDNFVKLGLEDFRLWSSNALKTYLRLRKKKNNGSFDELVAR